MLVKIDEGLALDMLMDRVKYWTDDEELYQFLTQNNIDCGRVKTDRNTMLIVI